MSKRLKTGLCRLCQRHCYLTFHHLIPRKMHRRVAFRKKYTKEERNQGIDICQLCHTGLHQLYDEMMLAKQFYTLEKLLSDPALRKHCLWVARQKVLTTP